MKVGSFEGAGAPADLTKNFGVGGPGEGWQPEWSLPVAGGVLVGALDEDESRSPRRFRLCGEA